MVLSVHKSGECMYVYLVTVVTTMLPPLSSSVGAFLSWTLRAQITPRASDYLRSKGHYWCIHLRPVSSSLVAIE